MVKLLQLWHVSLILESLSTQCSLNANTTTLYPFIATQVIIS